MKRPLIFSLRGLATTLLVLCLHMLHAQEGNERVTLTLEHAPIEHFIRSVELQVKYKFLYRNDLINKSKRLSYTCKDKALKAVLDDYLPQAGLTYRLKDMTIVLSPIPIQESKKISITGTVVNEQGEAIIGAAIQLKGTGQGTITDIDGNFKLEAALSDVIIISCVGQETIERRIGTSTLRVVMKDNAIGLSDVVVTGYQTINRKMFTGSASKVSADETLLKGSPDLTSSLQGKVAGVQITNVSGSFGASPIMTIRGNSSINGTNKPLWVVDGVVLEDLTTVSAEELTSGNLSTLLSSGVAGLNPEDISSFEILKDVSATSLYGAQAMNGVIVITTKQGKKDKLSVNYTGSLSMRQRPYYNEFNIMNSTDEMYIYKELVNKGWIDVTTVARSENFGAMGKMFDQITKGNINWGPNGTVNEKFLSTYANSNTDWFNILFHHSVVNQHSLSLSGGGDKTTYYASLSYYDDNGMAITSDKVKRYTASLRGKFNLSKTFNVGVKLSANIRDQRVPGTKDRSFDAITGEFTRDFDINPFNYALNTSRSMRAWDVNGNREYFRRSYTNFNILHELEHNFVDLSVRDITAQTDLEYSPWKNLTLKSSFQYRVANTLKEHKIHEFSNQAEAYRANYSQAIIDANRYLFTNPKMPTANPYSVLPEGGFYNTDESDMRHAYVRATADYSPKLRMNHLMNIFAGFELNSVNRKSRGHDGWGYLWDKGGVTSTHPDVMDYLSQQGDVYYAYGESRDRRISAFTNMAYSYAGRYIFNAGFRYDGSNQLGSSREARYLPSWNVSAAWNMHEEPFLRDSKIISQLKPKVSYGYNGIMGPATSAELTIYARQTLRPTDNEVYNTIESLRNKDLTWEKMYELNLGMEVALFKNRIMIDLAHYRRRSIDLIDIVYTSAIGGEAIKMGNIGNMNSKGFELGLNTVNIATKDFEWKTSLNLNFHSSEITKLNNHSRIAAAVSNTGVAMLGYPQRGLFSIRFAGLDNDGIPTFYGANNEIVQDMNLQSRTDVDKILKYEGPLEPKSYGGLTNNLRYKNWNLSVGIVYKWGNVIRLDDAFYASYNDYSAFPKELKNRWQVDGDEKLTNIPAILDKRTYKRIEGKQTYQMYNKSTERVAKGDFVRLKSLSLSYNMPSRWLKNTFINSANLSLQGTNLLLLYSDSKLNGIDPEFYLSGGVSLPVSRMYTFTVNLNF